MTGINKKHMKMNKKVIFVYSSKLVDMKKLVDSLRGVPPNRLFFFDFFVDFSHEITEKGSKLTKKLEKSSLTSF